MGIGHVLVYNMTVALNVGLVNDRWIGSIEIFKDIARIFAVFNGLHDDIFVNLRPSADSHNVVVVDDYVLVEVDHQLIDKDCYCDWLTLDAEDVACLVNNYQVFMILRVDLQIVEEGFLCPLVLFEQNAIRVRIADFPQEIGENGGIFFVHPMRALLVYVIVVPFEASVFSLKFLHDADVLFGELVPIIRRVLPSNLNGKCDVSGVVQL